MQNSMAVTCLYTLAFKINGTTCFMFSCFEQNFWINEHKNKKLRYNIHYETNSWILYNWGFGNYLQSNTNEFFSKNYLLKKDKILMFFITEIKWKVVIRMHYSQTEIDIPPKNYITTWVFPLIPFFFSIIKRLFKTV